MSGRRALHFVFKVADRTATAKFYREILGMKFLRHEEFEEGCAATCNGPYDGKWSKSMVGYGPEDNHFVTELTYNYGVKSYDLGNDFLGITIQCSNAVANAKKAQWPLTIESEGVWSVQAPGGYRFYLVDKPRPAGDPVQKVAIGVSNLQKSVYYWTSKCGMTLYEQTEKSALLGFGEGQCRLELLDQGEPIEHKTAFGRVAFSCPREQLPGIEAASKDAGETIITPLISLDTPGKATVEVVILGDPDGHEICFVGDEAFRELSQVDPKADGLLDEDFLPENYEHHICNIEIVEKEVKQVTLRLAVSTEEGAKEWLESMQKSSLATFRVERTYPTSVERVLYKTEFRCQHNTKPRSTTADQRKGSKNTNCPAGLSIVVKVSTFQASDGKKRKCRSSDPHMPNHPMVVKFKRTHNHPLKAADALRHRDVSQEVKEKFLDLFSKGYTPSKALELHKYDLRLQHNDNYTFISADRSIIPDLQYTYRLYYQTLKKENREAQGEFIFKELEIKIEEGLDDHIRLSNSCAEENGSDLIITELNKAFLAVQQSYIRDKEFFEGPVTEFTKKLDELTSGTDTALASALHCFGRHSGEAHAP